MIVFMTDSFIKFARLCRSYAAILSLCVLAACSYGILHDQITARLCVEYFTVGHRRILDTESPTILGFAWGILATWWAGVLLGCPLAIAACWGSRPRFGPSELLGPILKLLGFMAAGALLSGLVGYTLAGQGSVSLPERLAARIPEHRHALFLADAFAHSASYFIGFLGGTILVVQTWWRRRMLAFAKGGVKFEGPDTVR